MTDQSRIMNFSIIAHIDHGKSFPTQAMACVGTRFSILLGRSEFTQAARLCLRQSACTRLTAVKRVALPLGRVSL